MMSTKSAVTSLRSPSDGACKAAERLKETSGAEFGALSRALRLPQVLQKRASEGFEAPQRGQMSCNGDPQKPQYFDPSGLSPLQVRQRASATVTYRFWLIRHNNDSSRCKSNDSAAGSQAAQRCAPKHARKSDRSVNGRPCAVASSSRDSRLGPSESRGRRACPYRAGQRLACWCR
jgi:hypothetical protein